MEVICVFGPREETMHLYFIIFDALLLELKTLKTSEVSPLRTGGRIRIPARQGRR